jgi:hypothetical protein
VHHVGLPEFVVQGFGHRNIARSRALKQTEKPAIMP